MIRQTLYRLSQQRQLRTIATRNTMARQMARRFVAGETLDDAISVVRQINASGMTVTLDNLGENVSSRQEAAEATETACEILRRIHSEGVQCNESLKLTQLGLDIDRAYVCENLERVVALGAELDIFVRVDMEGAEYVERTLEIFYRVFERYQNVGAVIQSCLYRSASDIEQLNKVGARVRLVKGAYLEPATVAFARKVDVDANFSRLSAMLLSDGRYPAIATHDETMIDAAIAWASEHGIGPERFEFQMLYGVRRDLQTNLLARGYNVRVYVPYGVHWYPYIMRRLAERPANVMFVLSSIAREASAGGRKS